VISADIPTGLVTALGFSVLTVKKREKPQFCDGVGFAGK
jgi:hypothetical protein